MPSPNRGSAFKPVLLGNDSSKPIHTPPSISRQCPIPYWAPLRRMEAWYSQTVPAVKNEAILTDGEAIPSRIPRKMKAYPRNDSPP